jgi:HAD superfamily hydrolase (TIGR01509 family)
VELASAIGSELPEEIAASADPFDVLRYAEQLGEPLASTVERRFTELELDAVRTAVPTEHAHDVIRLAAPRSHLLAVVSNNSSVSIDAYLTAHGLRDHVAGIFARTSSDISQLKPSPYLLHAAMAALEMRSDNCVFVDDSTTDIQAAHAAGVPAIGYANKPGKAKCFAGYAPAAIIASMSEILSALSLTDIPN